MAPIIIRSPDDTPARIARDSMPRGGHRDKLSEEELRSSVRPYHPGGPDSLQMFEVEVQPNDGTQVHAHAEDEIIYVLAGELRFGSRVLTAGSSVHIPGMTLYSFRAGSDGARFLNVRARTDVSYFTKDDVMELRRGAGRVSDAP